MKKFLKFVAGVAAVAGAELFIALRNSAESIF